MTPEQRAVITDQLRAIGADAEATWLEDPMTGAKLAALDKLASHEEVFPCDSCGVDNSWGQRRPHEKTCAWVEAWRVTGDARYAEYLDACWEEAHAEQARRLVPSPPPVGVREAFDIQVDRNMRDGEIYMFQAPDLRRTLASDYRVSDLIIDPRTFPVVNLLPDPVGRMSQVQAMMGEGLIDAAQARRLLEFDERAATATELAVRRDNAIVELLEREARLQNEHRVDAMRYLNLSMPTYSARVSMPDVGDEPRPAAVDDADAKGDAVELPLDPVVKGG